MRVTRILTQTYECEHCGTRFETTQDIPDGVQQLFFPFRGRCLTCETKSVLDFEASHYSAMPIGGLRKALPSGKKAARGAAIKRNLGLAEKVIKQKLKDPASIPNGLTIAPKGVKPRPKAK